MLKASIQVTRSDSQVVARSFGNARLQLLSAVALGAFLVSAAPTWAKENGAGCQNLGAARIQQSAAATKCDPIKVPNIGHVTVTETSVGDDPMILDDAPSQPDGKPKKGGSKGGGNGSAEEPGYEPEGEPQKDGGSEIAKDGGAGTGKGKKFPGQDQIDKHPVGDIDHPDKVIVQKQPGGKGGKNGGGNGGGGNGGGGNGGGGKGGSGTPDDPIIAIAEEVEDIAIAEPDKPKIAIAEEVEDIAIAEPEPDYVPAKPKVKHKNGNPAGDDKDDDKDDEKVLSLEEPKDNIKTLEEPEDIVKHFEEPEEKVLHLEDASVVLGLKPVAPKPSSDQLKLTAGKKSDAQAKKSSPSADKSDRPGKDSKGGRDKGGRDKGGKADGGGRRR